MKILIITPGTLPDTHSGIGKISYYLAKELHNKGHETVILTRRYNKKHDIRGSIDGMPCYRVPYPARWGLVNVLWPIITPIQGRRWLNKLRAIYPAFDIVWVLNPWWTVLTDLKKIWPGVKEVCQFYCNPADEIIANNGRTLTSLLFGLIYNWVTKRCMINSDRVSALSKFARGDALAMIGTRYSDRVVIVPGGVDMSIFRSLNDNEKLRLRKELNLPADMPVFITSRGLKKRTGVDKLVDAASELKKEGTRFHIVIVGGGRMKQEIEKQIVVCGLQQHVRLVSSISESELSIYYRASDAFILPTQAGEAFGLSTVEAISSGIVAFGTNNGGTPEILNNYSPEWIIAGSDHISIYEKMSQYCKDPGKFSLPKSVMYDITARNFSWPSVADRFVSECCSQ